MNPVAQTMSDACYTMKEWNNTWLPLSPWETDQARSFFVVMLNRRRSI